MLGKLLRPRMLTSLLRPTRTFSSEANVPEYHSMHKKMVTLYDLEPSISHYGYISPSSTVAGDVYLGSDVSINDNVVIRGDINVVRISSCSHIGIIKNNIF